LVSKPSHYCNVYKETQRCRTVIRHFFSGTLEGLMGSDKTNLKIYAWDTYSTEHHISCPFRCITHACSACAVERRGQEYRAYTSCSVRLVKLNQCHLRLIRACLDSKKFCAVLVTSNLTVYAWSTKCKRKKINCIIG
jgi:hypothetical protein